MRIGLCQVDGKQPNLALMKLSAWHKAQGDEVAWFAPLEEFDRVYAAKVFDFTPDNAYLPPTAIKGGTGYDLTTNLPPEVEAMCPDYTLYPAMDYALGFTTRGCVRRCAFCVVPRKEGALRVVGDLHTFWTGQRKVILLDNNLTGAPMEHFALILAQIRDNGLLVDFSQGLDVRLLTDDHAALLAQVRLLKRIHLAWDNMRDEVAVRCGIARMTKHMRPDELMCYVLVGFNTSHQEDMHRINALCEMGVNPYVMPYNKQDPRQAALTRWCNRPAIRKSTPFERYSRRPVT